MWWGLKTLIDTRLWVYRRNLVMCLREYKELGSDKRNLVLGLREYEEHVYVSRIIWGTRV